MTDETNTPATPASEDAEPPVPVHVPFMQRVLDNPFLLLVLGITVPAALYLIWGVMEVASIPLAE